MKWKLVFTSQSKNDTKKLAHSGLKDKADEILDILEMDPFMNPPSYEKLVGDLKGFYSRRINIHHRVVYEVLEKEHIVKVLRLWTHYE